MAMTIGAAATSFASWVSATSYAMATGAGLSAATASTMSIYAAAAAYASVGLAVNATVAMGLTALATSQIPHPETAKQSRKQTRPLRAYAVGGPARMGSPYYGARQ